MTFSDEYTLRSELDRIFDMMSSDNDDTCDELVQITDNAQTIAADYTWNKFTDLIYRCYIKANFDHVFYTRVYDLLDENKEYLGRKSAYAHFVDQFKKGIIKIPYKIKVPNNFDDQNYFDISELSSLYDKIEDVETEYIYIHWYHNGRNLDFMKRANNSNAVISGTEMNMITSKIFDLFRGFNHVHIYQDLDKGLRIISDICKQNPKLDINQALSHYIDISMTE